MVNFVSILIGTAMVATTAKSQRLDEEIFVCTDRDFNGNCARVPVSIDECVTLPFNDEISSIRRTELSCRFFT
ncbi:hypothetical protein FB567DRAFT_610067 [Paraphoma chrysanthemicola]|uniref:Uncharacterized protein n=1 Tax=Paraphoma chrysanthemicola TaxID=798071 RepID=A0A8K0RFQ8_9PLEO|nr:hypothetical protein FB567DRAFT_610067 [Paraphoma chrysanthemicola]